MAKSLGQGRAGGQAGRRAGKEGEDGRSRGARGEQIDVFGSLRRRHGRMWAGGRPPGGRVYGMLYRTRGSATPGP